MNNLIQSTMEFVRSELENEGSGHDWWHIHRVTKTARRIAEKEGADLLICTMAALLHDLADEKLNETEEAGVKRVTDWLDQIKVTGNQREQILTIIQSISFKGGHGPTLNSLEAKVVQDADRLDAIGAIGIARCFTYAGSKGNIIHDPETIPREGMSLEEYRKRDGTAINHFYEKLLRLKDLMKTNTGYEMAKQRHQFMEHYLEEFFDEWSSIK
ncbi:HD domain-containing protein [Piscibacillus halophilus]|uniref:HD domain-containing protein n=1 Tax=Piscibacillus halophilus TaxID=571933 RepID=UPI00240966B2|nr:HD domain-containing protein [Piscibacillus halophilus]